MTLPTKIFLCALALGIAFDNLFFDRQGFGINLLLGQVLFLAVSFGLSKWTGHKLPKRAWIAGGFALGYSAVFAVWTGSFGLTIAFLGFFISNLLFISFALGHHGRWLHPFEIVATGTLELGWKLLSRLSIFRELRLKRLSSRQNAVLKGVVILIPILLIFMALFASADVLFRSYTDEIFSTLNVIFEPGRWAGHVFYVGFWGVLFTTVFAATFWQRFTHEDPEEIKPRFVLESQVIVGGIALLFASFLLVQGYALFGGEAAFSGMVDVTYAQYAREGFFQLVVCALLVIGVVLTLRLLHGDAVNNRLIAFHTFLIGETLLVLLSAFMRLNLYVDAYGYTPDRLFGYWVMLTLGVLLVLLLVSIVRTSSQSSLMRQGLIVLGISGLLFAWTPTDQLTATLNIKRHETCGSVARCKVDVYLLMSLTDEAYPVIKTFLDGAQEGDVQGFDQTACDGVYLREMLSSFYVELYDMNETTLGWEWQRWNWARKRLPDYYIDDPVAPAWLAIIPLEGCP
ncbi:DUF4173 domain-containing protein [Candidatus Uhrbacteria bacterium]|nr:DUF4173 domain-containing protein [Candidatus Uhrbacteria bacterium]